MLVSVGHLPRPQHMLAWYPLHQRWAHQASVARHAPAVQLPSAVSESGDDERVKVNWDLVIYPAAVQNERLVDTITGEYYEHIIESDFLAKWLCTESGTVALHKEGADAWQDRGGLPPGTGLPHAARL